MVRRGNKSFNKRMKKLRERQARRQGSRNVDIMRNQRHRGYFHGASGGGGTEEMLRRNIGTDPIVVKDERVIDLIHGGRNDDGTPVKKKYVGVAVYDFGDGRVLVAGKEMPPEVRGVAFGSHSAHRKERAGYSLEVVCISDVSSMEGLEKWESGSVIALPLKRNYGEVLADVDRRLRDGSHAFGDFVEFVDPGHTSQGRIFDVVYALVNGLDIPSMDYTERVNTMEQTTRGREELDARVARIKAQGGNDLGYGAGYPHRGYW